MINRKKGEALKDKIMEIDDLSKDNKQRKFYTEENKMKKGFQSSLNIWRLERYKWCSAN